MSIVIVGLGNTGLSLVKYFTERKMPVIVIDNREAPPKLSECRALYPAVPVYTGGFPKALLASATVLVLSPGISRDHPDIVHALSSSTEVMGDIEVFARALRAPVAAITGSNGKSTVTTLVGEMAKNAGISVGVGGNLGPPALSLLSEKTALYVLELSSFQLETTVSLKPTVATILNLSVDHLDRYASIDDYYWAKHRIYTGCEQVVFNREDPWIANHLPSGVPAVSFGLNEPIGNEYGLRQDRELWLAKGKKALLPVAEIKLFGRHNAANALAALALGDCLSLPLDAMLLTLQTFEGLAHRCEWVREHEGVAWINDSKGTNVGATSAALQGLGADIPGKWVLIAGGVGKNADFSPLKSLVARYCRAVVLMGEATEVLHSLFEAVVPCSRVTSMEDAVQVAKRFANPGDGVLLSPACASTDMFKDFSERGEAFKALVKSFS